MASVIQYLDASPGHSFNIIGTIFDSGPLLIRRSNVEVAQRAALATLHKPYAVTKVLLKSFASAITYKNIKYNTFLKSFDQTISEYSSLNPQLFMVSRADKIINYKDVIKIAEKRTSKGVSVHLKVWQEGDHVKILKSNEEEYRMILQRFVTETMKKSMEGYLSLSKETNITDAV